MKRKTTELPPSDAPSSPELPSKPLLTMVGLGPPVEDEQAPVAGMTAYLDSEPGPGPGDKQTLVGFPGAPPTSLLDAEPEETPNDAVTVVSSFDEITVVAQAPFLGRALIAKPPETPTADEAAQQTEPEVPTAPDASPALEASSTPDASVEPAPPESPVASPEPVASAKPLAALDALLPTVPAPPPDAPMEPARAWLFDDLSPPIAPMRRTLAQSFAVRTPLPTLPPPPLTESDPATKIFPPSLESLVPPPRKFHAPVVPAAVSTATQSDAPWFVSVPSEKSRLSRLPPAQRIALAALAAGATVALGAFALLPSTGHLLVTVAGPQDGVVPGAAVFVDGERACAPAPCRVTIPSGPHTISVGAPSYRRAAEKSLVVGRGSEEALHFTMHPDDRAALEVRVPAEGFRVYLDGKERGAAPTILRGLTPGEHTLQVSGHPRYAPFEQKVMLTADRLLVLAPSLVPAASTTELEPGPATDAVPVRELRARGTEDRPSAPSSPPAPTSVVPQPVVAAPVIPAPVDLDRVPGEVARASGKLSISSTPACNVVLDGRPLGPTPHEVTVSAGSHSVVFIHPSKGRKAMRVEAVPGKTAVAAMSF